VPLQRAQVLEEDGACAFPRRVEADGEEDAVRFDAKQRAGLDPARDYTTDAKCLECHTTGYGGVDGYPASPDVMGCVSCESCHAARADGT